ncbi:MAG TPA: ABC transporter substrate-binding protein [Methylomusa anaerophila]|uniref:Glycine betaine-binding periplasmic protein n=1 Tax=Methylomusa anaerophila TaxID=1930071 RepID=A0A348AI58_9FIRM|nr:ABC transporter substrate-binding protein [Methylomusa anaerophila]BBB90756.1 glycine betaine-binding periplasmic protein precursor [Methylomusa anaerophila]HML88640.1 ABC transporter substrate-binding protein [Methylomusa anaerophila]
MFKKKIIGVLLGVCLATILLPGCSGSNQSKSDTTIKFADAGWDSIKFHNAVAMFIIQHGMGYKTEEVSGTTTLTYQALKNNDIDAYMEVWSDNLATYKDDVAKGNILELALNYGDNAQGLYVPRYVIEGDGKRNIKAVAPDLKTVEDLKKYKDIFADPESPGKGRIYGAIPGWEVDKILYNKYMSYGLDKYYTYFRPGSDAALAAAISTAYEQGQPVVSYYWEPTWLTGKYDLVKLQDTPYDPNTFKEGKGDFPAVPVTIAAAKNIAEKAPEVAEFLKKYQTSSAITAQALAYMADNKASYENTAKWFLKNNENLWSNWVTSQQLEKVKAALK